MSHILIVEDETIIRSALRRLLERNQYEVSEAGSVQEAQERYSIPGFDLIVSDLRLPGAPGTELIKLAEGTPVLIMTSYASLRSAVDSMKMGAVDYIAKPFDHDEMLQTVARILTDHQHNAATQAQPSRGASAASATTDREDIGIIGHCAPMQDLFGKIRKVAPTDSNVLIQGESGTGKELVAEAIHQLGARKSGPFVAVNAAAIPSELIESELFGHEKGAFTGAINQAIGKFEQANGGTLFLDEIGDMPAEAQTRLLRALQSGTIRRVGGRQEISVNARIIAATNRNLAPMIAAGTFREDLFYRLNVVPIELPPLRQRREDIGVLAQHFLVKAAEDGLSRHAITSDAVRALEQRSWPGNVRELRNVIYRLALMARDDTIDAASVRDILGDSDSVGKPGKADGFRAALDQWLALTPVQKGALYRNALAAFEKPLFEHALAQTSGNQLRAAHVLGINRNTLRKRIVELGIDPDRFGHAI